MGFPIYIITAFWHGLVVVAVLGTVAYTLYSMGRVSNWPMDCTEEEEIVGAAGWFILAVAFVVSVITFIGCIASYAGWKI